MLVSTLFKHITKEKEHYVKKNAEIIVFPEKEIIACRSSKLNRNQVGFNYETVSFKRVLLSKEDNSISIKFSDQHIDSSINFSKAVHKYILVDLDENKFNDFIRGNKSSLEYEIDAQFIGDENYIEILEEVKSDNMPDKAFGFKNSKLLYYKNGKVYDKESKRKKTLIKYAIIFTVVSGSLLLVVFILAFILKIKTLKRKKVINNLLIYVVENKLVEKFYFYFKKFFSLINNCMFLIQI